MNYDCHQHSDDSIDCHLPLPKLFAAHPWPFVVASFLKEEEEKKSKHNFQENVYLINGFFHMAFHWVFFLFLSYQWNSKQPYFF
jgi:hypothetical protein